MLKKRRSHGRVSFLSPPRFPLLPQWLLFSSEVFSHTAIPFVSSEARNEKLFCGGPLLDRNKKDLVHPATAYSPLHLPFMKEIYYLTHLQLAKRSVLI